MENKTDIIENFQQYVTDLINGKVGKNIKLEFEELKTLNNLHLTFNYLTRYENDEDYELILVYAKRFEKYLIGRAKLPEL